MAIKFDKICAGDVLLAVGRERFGRGWKYVGREVKVISVDTVKQTAFVRVAGTSTEKWSARQLERLYLPSRPPKALRVQRERDAQRHDHGVAAAADSGMSECIGRRDDLPVRQLEEFASRVPDPGTSVLATDTSPQKIREHNLALQRELAQYKDALEDARQLASPGWLRFPSVDGLEALTKVLTALEGLARQIIESGGYSTPQLRHAVALLAEHGVDVRAEREVQS